MASPNSGFQRVRPAACSGTAAGSCRAPLPSLERRFTLALSIVLAFQGAAIAWEACHDSPTWDEVGHLAAGLSIWQTGSCRLYCVNPPLVRAFGCLPVLLLNPVLPPQYFTRLGLGVRPEFAAGQKLIELNGSNYFMLLITARLACGLFALLGTLICYAWAKRLYGRASGVVAAMMWAFCPLVVGFGHLITPDVGASFFGAAAAYFLWRWLGESGWPNALIAGIVLGVAELTKMTWLIAFVVWPSVWILYAVAASKRIGPSQIVQFVGILAISVWVLNLGYGFDGSFKKLGDYAFVSRTLGGPLPKGRNGSVLRNRFAGNWIGELRVPLPEDYVLGLDLQKVDFENHLLSYFRGEWRNGGWWQYYIVGLFIKLPLGTWLIVGISLILTVANRHLTKQVADLAPLLLPPVALFVFVSSQTGFSHHVRYVLPALPFMFIWASGVARSATNRNRAIIVVWAGALAWSIVEAALVFPHSLSYYNEVAGGPMNGHRWLGNSNSDWGQDLFYLKQWYVRNPPARHLYLAYDMPLIDPRIVGIDWTAPPLSVHYDGPSKVRIGADGPRPGWYAISVNQLHALHHDYDYLSSARPIARIGYTIRIYHLTISDVARFQKEHSARPHPEGPSRRAKDAFDPP